jgi:asparagine synthase (glutamine-hydrolysing)
VCGISGIVRLDSGHVEKWRLKRMNRSMAHRGPDGEGFWIGAEVGLAHLRLAIIDLVAGDQPIFNEDGSILVVFNGEIYNFLDLRTILEKLGHIFNTQSDTEVLVHAYEQWGNDMLSKLNGMFAFAIYDRVKRKLLLARDRLGVKPLFYYLGRDVLVFASEMTGLTSSGLIPRNIDLAAIELYSHYQYIPSPFSIYQGVKKLCPAEFLDFDIPKKEGKVEQYWDIETSQPPDRSKTFEDYIEELDALLHDCVRIRLISDVPFGAFLSGGVDSGLVVAMMASKLAGPVKTFSIGLLDGEKDELPYARKIAERFKSTHEEFRVSPEGLTLIPKLSFHFGEPFADSSAVPTYYVSKIASSKVKMVLTGDGGDEMFAGYRSYSYLLKAFLDDNAPTEIKNFMPNNLYTRFGTLLRRGLTGFPKIFKTTRFMGIPFRRWLNTLSANIPWYHTYDNSMSHFNFEERKSLFKKNIPLSGSEYFPSRFQFSAADNVVGMAQYCDVKSYLPGDILVKVDRMSMANSLEVRSPLLDYRIAELAFSMPTCFKLSEPSLDGSKNKFILKELAARYLGREYVYRPKEGFGIPVSQWLRNDKASYLKDNLLLGSPIYDFFNKDFVHGIINAHLAGTGDYSAKLWNLLMLDGWLRNIHQQS